MTKIESITGMDEPDTDWAIKYLQYQSTRYNGLNPTTVDRLKMDEVKFVIGSYNMYRILKDGD